MTCNINFPPYVNNLASKGFWVGSPSGPELIRVNCSVEQVGSQGILHGVARYDNNWQPPEMCADNSAALKLSKIDKNPAIPPQVVADGWTTMAGQPNAGSFSWVFPWPADCSGLYRIDAKVYDNSVYGYCNVYINPVARKN